MICDVFMEAVERFAQTFGTPLPQRLLEIGDPDKGWGVKLNPTAEAIGDVDPFHAVVTWNGFPAGIMDPMGGIIAAGDLANQETFVAWLKSDVPA